MATAESSLSMTAADLYIEAAVEMRTHSYDASTGAKTVPANSRMYSEVQRVTRNAFRKVLSEFPDWEELNQPLDLTFEVGKAEYDMPWWFGGPGFCRSNRWTYVQSGTRMCVEIADEERLREARASDDSSGDPFMMAFRHQAKVAPTSHNRPKWVADFYPTPTGTQTVRVMSQVYPDGLDSEDDRIPFDPRYDDLIRSAVLAEAEMQRLGEFGPRFQQYQAALMRARAINDHSKPRMLGHLTVGHEADDERRGTLYVNGTLV